MKMAVREPMLSDMEAITLASAILELHGLLLCDLGTPQANFPRLTDKGDSCLSNGLNRYLAPRIGHLGGIKDMRGNSVHGVRGLGASRCVWQR